VEVIKASGAGTGKGSMGAACTGGAAHRAGGGLVSGSELVLRKAGLAEICDLLRSTIELTFLETHLKSVAVVIWISPAGRVRRKAMSFCSIRVSLRHFR